MRLACSSAIYPSALDKIWRCSIKRHITPVDVFFYVLEGTGVVEIGKEKQTVGPVVGRQPREDPALLVQ